MRWILKLKKKIISIGLWTGLFLATVIVAYAITNLFFTQSRTTGFSKKVIFQFNLGIGTSAEEVGPGDSISVNPVVTNSATEDMYVFVKIQMPEWDGSPLYTFRTDETWVLVESGGGAVVYAYADPEMTTLSPGDSTFALTNQMTMRSISNAEYAVIDDINITITGYAIGTENVSTNPNDAWNECKEIGNIW